MEALPRCPSCRHDEWVRANVVVVPGAQGPLRVSTNYLNGPSGWTCANCGYTEPCGGEVERLLERVPERVTIHPSMARRPNDARASDEPSAHHPPRGDYVPREPRPEPGGSGVDDRLVGAAVGQPTGAHNLLRITRRVPAPPDLSIGELIIRIRWERAKRAALEPGSEAYLAVGEAEARLIRELHHRFGVENITASDLEWYVQADRDKGCRRDPTDPG